jgi:hypothetical protein
MLLKLGAEMQNKCKVINRNFHLSHTAVAVSTRDTRSVVHALIDGVIGRL